MPRMILICGRVCSGKTTYAKRIARAQQAVRFNADELMKPLFGEYLGERYEEVLDQVVGLLLEKAAECYACGVSVVLDLGFWQRKMRERANRFFADRKITPEWYYLRLEETEWRRRIAKRNAEVASSGSQTDYLIDENIIRKFLDPKDEPQPGEMEVLQDAADGENGALPEKKNMERRRDD